jgi:hypothetical protein
MGPEGAMLIDFRVVCGGGGVLPPVEAALPPPQPTKIDEASKTGARISAEILADRIAFTSSFS